MYAVAVAAGYFEHYALYNSCVLHVHVADEKNYSLVTQSTWDEFLIDLWIRSVPFLVFLRKIIISK